MKKVMINDKIKAYFKDKQPKKWIKMQNIPKKGYSSETIAFTRKREYNYYVKYKIY